MLRLNRTIVLAGVLVITVGAAIVVFSMGGSVFDSQEPVDADTASIEEFDDEEYSFVQDGNCMPIEPMGDGHQSIEDFYDYRNPNTTPPSGTYSSHGTTHLQEDDTSILMLHEGSGGMGIVFVHDMMGGDTDGGAATLQFTNLPPEGEWVVEDDNYTGAVEEWDHGETTSRITNVWSESRTDGGAFVGGLDDDFAVEVTPRFNDFADFQVYDGEVEEWQALSGPEHDPDRFELDMHETVEIRSIGCTPVTHIDVSRTGEVGEETEVTATIVNEGFENETVTVPFAVNGEVVDEQDVDLDPGEEATVSTTVEYWTSGDQYVSAGHESATVSVSGDDNPLPGFGIVAGGAALAILGGLLVWARR